MVAPRPKCGLNRQYARSANRRGVVIWRSWGSVTSDISSRNLEVMKDFWGNFMGMTLTKSSEGAAFYSAYPEGVDHEIAMVKGRPETDDSHLIQQISLRVESLDDVRDFKRRAIEKGYKIDRLVTHASAIGLYFRDPEGNRVETFWLTGLPSWAIIGVPIHIDRPDDEVMADGRRRATK